MHSFFEKSRQREEKQGKTGGGGEEKNIMSKIVASKCHCQLVARISTKWNANYLCQYCAISKSHKLAITANCKKADATFGEWSPAGNLKMDV